MYRVLTYLLTCSMEQIPRIANRFAASQEIPHILWNPTVHYRIHMCLLPVPILRSYQSINTGPRLSVRTFRNVMRFYPPAGGPPLVGCPRLLIQYIRAATRHIRSRSSIRNLRTPMPW